MVRSFRPMILGLSLGLALALAAVPALRADEPLSWPPAEGQKDARDQDKNKDKDAKPERPASFALPGEDAPQPFVPLHPRTVEDRRRIEAITAYSVARALEDKRSLSESISLLEEALKLDPDSITILRRLSRVCFVLGRTEAGIKYCKQVLELDPGDTDTISRLVGYYNRRNDQAGAEAVLKDVLSNPRLDKNAPGRLIAEFELGKLYSGKLRQIDKAADAFAKVVDALDEKAANKLSQSDQRRILGGEEAQAYQEFGLTFLQAKRYDLAIKAFERGLDYDPEDPQLPLLLARTLLKVNKGEQALREVEQFLKRQPHELEGYELLSEVLKALKRPEEITPRLEAAVKNDSKNVALRYALADHYREIGRTGEAEALYKSLLAEQPTTQGYGALAASLLKRKKAEELLKVLSEAIGKPGGQDAVMDSLKGITEDPEFADEVLEAGRKLLAADPPALDRPGILVLLHIAKETKKLDKFLPVQKLLLERSPSPQAYKEYLVLLLQLKRYGDAASVMDDFFKRYPEERNGRQIVEQARFFRLADRNDEAVRAAHEAIQLDPNDTEVRLQAALILSQAGKVDESVAMLRELAKKDPGNVAPSLLLGGVLAQAGQNDEAIALFKDMLEKSPNNDEVIRQARSNLSIIYVNMGDYAKGEAELEALLERTPDEPGVNNDLGYLYADQGKNLEKAESMIRKALMEEPENPAYLDSLGWVLFKRGKVKEAVDPLEKAVKLLAETPGSGDATIYEHLGDVYFQLQETARAKAAWKTAEKSASKATPPDKRLPEIRKKLQSLEKLSRLFKVSAGRTP